MPIARSDRKTMSLYKREVVSAKELARREGLERDQIYKWRVQLERPDRLSRIESLTETISAWSVFRASGYYLQPHWLPRWKQILTMLIPG